jgi:hypothetical protein
MVEGAGSTVEHEGLEKACVIIEDDAKASLGEYQPAAGPFPAWQGLAESTQDRRSQQGYSADDPLLRSKTLQLDITHQVEGRVGMIGVPASGPSEPEGAAVADVAMDMELGTSRAPPRPFMGPAAFRKGEAAAKEIGAVAISYLAGGKVSAAEIKVTKEG